MTGQGKEALSGISLKVEEKRAWRFGPHPSSDVNELETGATGPSKLQLAMISENRRATIELSAEQARWLAKALAYWADSSEQIAVN